MHNAKTWQVYDIVSVVIWTDVQSMQQTDNTS